MTEFIEITHDGEHITSPMPADETLVEERLDNGSVSLAMYHCNLLEAGDWDFVPHDDSDGDSLADKVQAWRAVLPGLEVAIDKTTVKIE